MTSTIEATRVYNGSLRKDPHVKKSYFHVDTPNGPSREFVKHAYQLLPPNSGNVVLLHYMGDERAVVPFMHGNAKAHIRTCPSVLRSMKNECNHATPATTVYRKLATAVPSPMHMPVKQLLDTKQAKNIRFKLLEKHRRGLLSKPNYACSVTQSSA